MTEQDSGKKVLIVSNHYLDLKSGGSLVSLAYINALATLYKNCTLIFPERPGSAPANISRGVIKIPVADKRSRIIKGLHVYSGRLHRFSKTVIKYLSANDTDLIVFDTSVVSGNTIRKASGMVKEIITIHHNVEADYLADNPPGILYRLPYIYFARKFEKTAIRHSDLNMVLSAEDRSRFEEIYGTPNSLNIKVTGVFNYRAGNEKSVGESKPVLASGSPKFVISGNLAFKQSDIASMDFIKQYWPLVKDRMPGAVLIITGAKPGRRLIKACYQKADIGLYPDPDNISDIVSACDYYISPVYSGSGIKLRAMDGLKCGLPVIAHSISARGYSGIIEAGCMFSYSSEDSFIDALDRVENIKMSKKDIKNAYLNEFSLEKGIENIQASL